MRSSTFSFDRAESGFSLFPMAFGLLGAIAIIVVIEFSWRQYGATPGYVDSKPRWSWIRSQVSDGSDVALLGASRMQFGFSLAAFRDRYAESDAYQLAVAGSWPYATLRDLASDEQFNGVALVSFTPDVVMPFRHNDQSPNVDHYHDRWNIDVRLNFFVGSFAESLMVTRHQNYGIDSIVRKLLNSGELPPAVLYMETTFDREVFADYSEENLEQHRGRRLAEAQSLYDNMYPVSTEQWQESLDSFLGSAHAIYDRGGCVIAIRFPSQGSLYAKEQELFPKQDFWDVLESVPYLGTAHFESLNIMDEIELPDLQHVDKADKYQFTVELLKRIEEATESIAAANCTLGS